MSKDQIEKINSLEAELAKVRLALSDEEMACQELRNENKGLAISSGNVEIDRNRIVNEFLPEFVHRFLGSHELKQPWPDPSICSISPDL